MRRSFICLAFLVSFSGLLSAQAPIDEPRPVPSTSKKIRVKVTEPVANAFVTHRVAPQYPDAARQARLQGTVVVEVVVDTEGNVKDVRLISGHPMLVQAAIDAVRQWKFKPYLLNREPVELDTILTIPFSLGNKGGNTTDSPASPETNQASGVLGDTPMGPPEPGSPTPARIRVSQGVSEGLLIRKTAPEYPADTHGAKGPVALRIKVGKDGTVESAEFLRGDERLAQAAIDAVKQWRYKPYLLNGSPIEMDTTATVEFKKRSK